MCSWPCPRSWRTNPALPSPFFVIATQNPHDQLGTYALPESQLDRFLMRISLGTLDRSLLLAVFALLGIGLLMIASAGVAYGKVRFGDEYFFLKQQCVGFTVGIISLFIVSRIDYHIFRKFVVPLFFLAITLLILVDDASAARFTRPCRSSIAAAAPCTG